MLLFFEILFIVLSIIFAILGLYCAYCIFGLVKLRNAVSKDKDIDTDDLKGSKFNIFIWLLKKSKKIANATGKEVIKIIKRKSFISIIVATSLLINFMLDAFVATDLAIVTNSLNSQFTTVASIVETLFSKDKDCPCYAKCTGDKEDDKYCVYELLFGPTEYDKLVNDMKKGMTFEEQEQFDVINKGEDGKEKSTIIRNHINDNMVADYKALVGNNSKFRHGDKLDRSKMSDDELKNDLRNLLCDYKVNGRNPNCKCKTCSDKQFKYKCLGEEHYVDPWSWENKWADRDYSDPDNNNSGSSNGTGCIPGQASGNCAIKLTDGTWYWYHQSSEDCKNNVKSSQFKIGAGSLHARRGNGDTYEDALAYRGCSIYSTAMAVSNILGEEVTPWDVVNDIMKCKITKNSYGEVEFKGNPSYGIDTKASTVKVTFSTLANTINNVYSSQGLKAKEITFSQDEVDKYLDSDKYYAMVINSYTAIRPWYTGSHHFMVLRGKTKQGKKGKYYGMTSAGTYYGKSHDDIIKAMNEPLEWSKIKNAARHSTALVIYRDKSLYQTSSSSSGGSGLVGYNKEVYDILIKNPKYASKAKALAEVYALLEPQYGKNFAYGAMGNIYAEGNTGLVEAKNDRFSYWNGVSQDVLDLAGKRLYEQKNPSKAADTLLKLGDHKGIGIGMVGWSGGRRKNLLNRYKKYCKNWTRAEMEAIEIKFMDDEFKSSYAGGWYYRLVVAPCKGKSVKECAGIICDKYEAPGTNTKSKRQNAAEELSRLLKGVKTHGITSQTTSNSKGQKVADYACKFVGNHYVYGGTTITCKDWSDSVGTDCSGFVLSVYKHFGKSLPRQSGAQASVGTEVKNPSEKNMQPGDIVCYSGHVAIYIGNGKIVHASNPSSGIKISDKWNYRSVVSVRRIFN